MTKLRINHNLNEVELEEALEKALKGIKAYKETPKELPDKFANEINENADGLFDNVLNSMLTEIKAVLEQK